MALFSAIQIETGQPLGPPDGRYVKRSGDGEDPTHVLVFAGTTLTVVDVREPLVDAPAAAAWLKRAGEDELAAGLAVVEIAMHAFRVITTDPHLMSPSRRQLLSAKLGWGEGPELSEGRMAESKLQEVPKGPRFKRRAKVLEPQAKLAAALSGREPPLVCAELVLRASFDFENGRDREAALSLMVALNAEVTELSVDPKAEELSQRIHELRDLLPGVIAAAQTALSGPLSEAERTTVAQALGRAEAALRARAVLRS